ncbi:MAG: hypothetical protein ABW022_26235 [Actinoplanes sp.]
MPSTEHGRLPLRRSRTGHRAPHIGLRRREAGESSLLEPGQRAREIVSSVAVILAGVLVVIGFGLVASRVMSGDDPPPPLPEPAAPALGDVALPSSEPGLIPLESPTPTPSPSRTTTPPTTPVSRPPDVGAITLVKAGVPDVVNLSAEGTRDWVHWGQDGTFSLERDKDGDFAILEGAPTAPRVRHTLSPQRFRWTGGDPVGSSDGTPTGIHTCGKNNGFTLTAPAGTATRTLRLYVGVLSAKGRLQAKLSAGPASASTTLDQRGGDLRTSVVTLTYRAPKSAQLRVSWVTEDAYGDGCGGVALEAATLR